jgi:Protein of unknown function (DUF2778)
VSKATFAVASLAMASGFASWIAEVNPLDLLRGPALAHGVAAISFDDRFGTRSTLSSTSIYYPSRLGLRGSRTDFNAEFAHIEGSLTEQLDDAPPEQPAESAPSPPPAAVASIPLPRSRPAEANLALKVDPPPPPVAQEDNRNWFQKIADLMPAKLQLASLEPNGGIGILPGTGPNLTALGYDSTTAVYDISARTVYMPDGTKLEAHSGLGSLMDDPNHVNRRNVGATPPGIYEMKPREQLFHGVAALRMIPVDGSDTFGRSGLLVHSYLLGPNGESNGCVSIKSYDRFLQAFRNGEIKRIVVVTDLNNRQTVSTRSPSQS